ncbi:sulfurtransferase TusA family protein [Isoptericola sp. NEAU-Y5]|uniref:Sulfurtransferase TusA family protein n=1 Tax=Isoptericola luteus TaxID=2879484 RepID=A0ABS7ZK48_9MICO|nr:sulfurtransferase TusA family protein [Isoptericola sp. NEAU-Y5]MCA5895258.1 sulfurtransferase TusA family protein [Isoptericola sp. NEAU-Y5]
MPDIDVVDARGLRCPLPVIRLAARARDLPPGAVLTVLATDPAARHDVPAWARMRGHAMQGEDVDGDVWRLTVRLGATTTTRPP